MAKLDVEVRFDSNSKQFTFVPEKVYENDKGGGTVLLHRTPSDAPWHFTDAKIKNDDGTIRPKVVDAGATVEFHNKNSKKGDYQYYVVIEDKHGPHKSPDPQIINSGPQMMSLDAIYPVVGAVVGAIAGALIDSHTGLIETRGMFKGLIVGAVIGAIVGLLLGRMLAGRRAP